MIIEEYDSDDEITDEVILEHSQDLKIQKLMDKMIGKDPNTYFLKLAQSGAKLPTNFNIEVLKDPNLIPLGYQSVVRQIPKTIVDPKIPPLFSRAHINDQYFPQNVENPLYRHQSQIEQAMVTQHTEDNPNLLINQNMPPQNVNTMGPDIYETS